MIYIIISDKYDDMLRGYDAVIREVAINDNVRLYPHIDWCRSPREVAAAFNKLLSSTNNHDVIISTLTLTLIDYLETLGAVRNPDDFKIIFCSGDERTEFTVNKNGVINNYESFPWQRFDIYDEVFNES